ncbi:MBL fold metallo-hydrolase [Mycolicibacterium litorale]|uniref:MBL fold metallo-hydrolase n=1 Tax=Mycolicibacterium litorale TaxID=758802 RepID=A0AAD1MW22_9MYCO|nr:MBL fold metallo-hydrolase [Mycolicibacterium litorale]MCV7416816.1 MBL fold metallo-hydrolase [Mycolicibacterium litorale]TDY04601.1 glyoxylase-like metal-dependent hydrolase (beta-lactamase superfamily II) [Mycolicibacterium litorale]BBY18027.1 MBL fold metallo-hydrolase [Mycolicibacterium litorale]
MAATLTAVTDRVHLAHTDLVNWTLVTDGGGVLLIDAGYPGHRDDVVDSVRRLGFEIADIRAILLTHAHVDHFGSAIWFAATHGVPVYAHLDEVGHARREYLEQVSPLDVAKHVWQPRWLKWSLTISRKGGLEKAGIPTAQALTEEVAATLPGTPRAVPTPGHTGGHCSYVVDGVLVSGDALVTGHPLLTDTRPQLLPSLFNHDQARCVQSLAALETLESDVLLPGHGPLWRGPVRDAARAALR